MVGHRRSKVIKEGQLSIADSLKDLLNELRVSKDMLENLGEIIKYSTGDTSDAVDKIKKQAKENKADAVYIKAFPYTTTGDPNSYFCVYGVMYKIKQKA